MQLCLLFCSVALLKLPVLCFVGSLHLSDLEVLPHLKQDSKDLTRDVIQINGTKISGAVWEQKS